MPAAAELQALLSWRLYRTETSPPVLSPACGVPGPADNRVCSPQRQRSFSPPPELPPQVVYHAPVDSPVAASGATRQRSFSPRSPTVRHTSHQRSWSPPVLRTPQATDFQQQHPAQRFVQFKVHDDGHCPGGDGGQQHFCSECQQLRMQNMRLLERLQEKEWAEQEMKARLELMEQQHQAQLVRIRRQLSMESQSCRRLIVKLHDLQHVVNALEQGSSARPKKKKEVVDLAKVGLGSKVGSIDDDPRGVPPPPPAPPPEKVGNRPKQRMIRGSWQQQQHQQQLVTQRSLQQQAPDSQYASVEMQQQVPESEHASVETPQRSPQHQASESQHASVETMQYDGGHSMGVSAKIRKATPVTAGSSQSTSQGGSEGSSLTHEFSGSMHDDDFSGLPHGVAQRKQPRSMSVDSFDFRTHLMARDVDDPRAIKCPRDFKDPRARSLRDPRTTVWCKPAEPADEKAATTVVPVRRR